MSDLKPGETFVPVGANPGKTARTLLAQADKAGLPVSVVRTTEGGFIVPDAAAPGTHKPATKPKGKRTARILPVDPPPEPDPSATASRGRRRKKTTK